MAKTSTYQDIINLLRQPGKVYIPVDFGLPKEVLVAVEKKDMIEAVMSASAKTECIWTIGRQYLDGMALERVTK